MNTLNHLTDPRYKSKQLVVLDATNSGGLFAEDFIDVLMLTQPNSLVTHLLGPTTPKKPNLTSQTVTRKLLNTIVFRENYLWKSAFVKNKNPRPDVSVLDLFDSKYSNPVLSIQDAHDIFYAGNVINQSGVDDLTLLVNRSKNMKKYGSH